MATFLQLRGRVKDAAQRPSNLDDTETGALVNDAYLEVCSRLRIPVTSVTKTLTANQGDYTITSAPISISDLTEVIAITCSTSNGTMLEESPDNILFYRNRGTIVGAPSVYAIAGLDLLMVWPLPQANDTLTIYYSQRPAIMVADGDTPSALPTEWHDLVELGGVMRAMRVTSTPEARQCREDFRTRLRDYTIWQNTRRGSRARQIGPNHLYRQDAIVAPGEYFGNGGG